MPPTILPTAATAAKNGIFVKEVRIRHYRCLRSVDVELDYLTLLIGHRMANLTTLLLPFAAGTYLYIAQAVGRSALRDRRDDPTHWGRLGWSAAGLVLVLAFAFGG